VLEAALSGCALVLSDLPSLRENWDGAAVFVEPQDDRTLRLTLESLIANPDLRHALARRARSRALELTPERMAGAYLAVYRSLLTSSDPAGGPGMRIVMFHLSLLSDERGALDLMRLELDPASVSIAELHP